MIIRLAIIEVKPQMIQTLIKKWIALKYAKSSLIHASGSLSQFYLIEKKEPSM